MQMQHIAISHAAAGTLLWQTYKLTQRNCLRRTRMMGLTAEAPSGTHCISRPSSFCMVGRCCRSSTVLQSFSLMGFAALGPCPVAMAAAPG